MIPFLYALKAALHVEVLPEAIAKQADTFLSEPIGLSTSREAEV